MQRSTPLAAPARAASALASTPRRLFCRLLVALALAAAEAALGTWWAGLLLARGDGLGIDGALGRLGGAPGGSAPGGGGSGLGAAGGTSAAASSLGSALGLAGRAGSSTLGLDNLSGGTLGGLLGAGDNGGSAHLAHQLHGDAAIALVTAAALAVLAVVVAPRRRQAVLRLASGVGAVAGMALLVTWPGAAIVSAWSHGSVHRGADAVLRAGVPVRWALGVAVAAAALAAAAAALAGTGRARRRHLLTGIGTPTA